jgi:hypothetical protein
MKRALVSIFAPCRWCGQSFHAPKLSVVYCSPRCGMFARGRDENGRFMAKGAA